MYAAMVLQTKLESPLLGRELSLVIPEQRVLGVIPVFKTKKAAREIYGRDVVLLKIQPSVFSKNHLQEKS